MDKTQLDLLNAGDELRCICDDDDCMEEVTWFRDGKPVGNEMQTMVDKIIFMGYEQPGKYSCKVGDKMSHPAEVRERCKLFFIPWDVIFALEGELPEIT